MTDKCPLPTAGKTAAQRLSGSIPSAAREPRPHPTPSPISGPDASYELNPETALKGDEE